MSYSNGLLQTKNNSISYRGPPGKDGDDGIGFKLTDDGN